MEQGLAERRVLPVNLTYLNVSPSRETKTTANSWNRCGVVAPPLTRRRRRHRHLAESRKLDGANVDTRARARVQERVYGALAEHMWKLYVRGWGKEKERERKREAANGELRDDIYVSIDWASPSIQALPEVVSILAEANVPTEWQRRLNI